MDGGQLSSEPCKDAGVKEPRVKSCAPERSAVQHQALLRRIFLEPTRVDCQCRVECSGRVPRIMLIAGMEHADSPRANLAHPVPGAGRDIEPKTYRHLVQRQRAVQRHRPANHAASVDDAVLLCECEAPCNAARGHLRRLKSSAVDGVA